MGLENINSEADDVILSIMKIIAKSEEAYSNALIARNNPIKWVLTLVWNALTLQLIFLGLY